MKCIDGVVYFTVDEVARLLGTTVRTVQRWLSEPEHKPNYAPSLRPYVFPNGRKYFKKDDIQDAYSRALGAAISDEALKEMLQQRGSDREQIGERATEAVGV